ncbi:MAG TPA: hypothetical protein VF763_14190 [Candidatus Limnocylindrales bacterium]
MAGGRLGSVLRTAGSGLVGLLAALYYTGTPPFDVLPSVGGTAGGDAASAETTAARFAFWLVVGLVGGVVGGGAAGLPALWAGVLGGYLVGLVVAGADQNVILLYLLVTLFGAAFFATPGYLAGWLLAGRLGPPTVGEGSVVRAAPPPLRGDVPEPTAAARPPDPLRVGRDGAAVPLTAVRRGHGDADRESARR